MRKTRKTTAGLCLCGLYLTLANFFTALAAPEPELRPPQFSLPPVIDGVFDDAVWEVPAVFSVTNSLDAVSDLPETTARMGYDASYLYLAVDCAAPELTDNQTVDRLEIFAGTSHAVYFQFTVDFKGRMAQQAIAQGQGDDTWQAFWICAVSNYPGGWRAEIALPFCGLRRSVVPEAQMRFNLARVISDEPAVRFSWAPLGAASQKRGLLAGEKFGRLADLNKLRVRSALPQIVSAKIIGPYKSLGADIVYPLEIVLNNPSAASFDASLLARETVTQKVKDSFRASLWRKPAKKTHHWEPEPEIGVAKIKKIGVMTVPAWAVSTNVFPVMVQDANPRLLSTRIDHAVLTQSWVEAKGGSWLTPGVRKLSSKELSAYGVNDKELDEPLGGGDGYKRIINAGDRIVRTPDELSSLLSSLTNEPIAAPGIIYLPPETELDFTGKFDPQKRRGAYPFPFLYLPEGWTLAGNRGENGAPGPLVKLDFTKAELEAIRADKETPHPYTGKVLLGLGAGARVTGLRIQGPDPGVAASDYDDLPRSRFTALHTMGAGAEVDNCQISHFHWAGINAAHPETLVRYNRLIDIHAYPAVVGGKDGRALILGNYIEWSWHAIAGGGQQDVGYEAAHNEIVHVGPGGPAHAVDMHAWRQMMYRHGPEYPFLNIAGNEILIHHNTFKSDTEAIKQYRKLHGREPLAHQPVKDVLIRGVPRKIVLVESNLFFNAAPDMACSQHCDIGGVKAPPGGLDWANFWVRDNVYGLGHHLIPRPRETRPRIRFLKPALEVPQIMLENKKMKWSTRHVNILRADEKMPVEIDIETMPPHEVRQVKITAGNLDLGEKELYSGNCPPSPGEIVLDAADWGSGYFALTVWAKDERGVWGRYSTSFTVE